MSDRKEIDVLQDMLRDLRKIRKRAQQVIAEYYKKKKKDEHDKTVS